MLRSAALTVLGCLLAGGPGAVAPLPDTGPSAAAVRAGGPAPRPVDRPAPGPYGSGRPSLEADVDAGGGSRPVTHRPGPPSPAEGGLRRPPRPPVPAPLPTVPVGYMASLASLPSTAANPPPPRR